MKPFCVFALRVAPAVAALLFVVAVAGFGAALDGYSQALHPVALLGAAGFPHAFAFNMAGFVVPGILVAAMALGLRAALPAPASWSCRIGAQLLLLAALAFTAMGLLPLHTEDMEGQASRLHGSAWMLWSLAFTLAGLALGIGWLRRWRRWAACTFAAVAAFLVAAFVLPSLLPAGGAQRLAFGVWWVWLAGTGLRFGLRPASSAAAPAALR